MKKKCYIYTRVSTAAQVEGYSLDAQEGRLREYAEYRELEIAGEYCDAGKSGHSIKGRPEFQRMMDDVVAQKDRVSFVLVFKLSRFGRNAADVLKSMQLLSDYDVDLVSVEDSIDSSTQGGRLMLSILSAVAEIERENITVQFMAGKEQRIQKGEWKGGPIPYGYRNVEKHLVPEPVEAETVKKIYELYLQEGMTIRSVVVRLADDGCRYVVKGEEKPFTWDIVSRILKNPVYCGRYIHNRRSGENSEAGKKQAVFEMAGRHEVLVSPEEWDAAQEKISNSGGCPELAGDPGRVNLLSGLVRCPVCGGGLVRGGTLRGNPNHGGYYKPGYYYACRNHRKENGRICSFGHVYRQEKLDAAVAEVVGGLTQSQDFRREVIDRLADQGQVEKLETEMKNCRKRLRSCEMSRRKLGTQLDALDFLAEDYDAQYDAMTEKMDALYDQTAGLEEAMVCLEQRQKALENGIEAAGRIVALLDNLNRLYDHMPDVERREMFRLLIRKIEVFPERPDGRVLKSIDFRFPVYYGEKEALPGTMPDGEVYFTLDCSEMEKTAAESKATYAQIKAYILEKFGLNVSTLYIAQIKRECGIIEQVNYNLPKKEGARVPKCPAKKREAILDAFRFFRMIDDDMAAKEETENDCRV